ncbi:hypothetical protein EJB05_01849, partial [Eragrostis curvula]
MHRAAEVTGSVIFEDSQAPSVVHHHEEEEQEPIPPEISLHSQDSAVSQVPKGRGRKPEMAGKDEDSVEEGRAYPSLCNWYKDEDSDEEGWVSPSRFNWYKD